MTRITVGVESARDHDRYRRLLDALELRFPVLFVVARPETFGSLGAMLFFGTGRDAVIAAARRGIQCLAVMSATGLASANDDAPVKFQNSRALATFFRGQTLLDPDKKKYAPVPCAPDEEPVALKSGQPIWVHRPAAEGCGAVDFVSLTPPELSEDAYLTEFFNQDCYLSLLPLVNFVRRLTEGPDSHAADLRACMVFDDPCLRWNSYGYLKFQDLANHARTWNYHAAIALIPLTVERVSTQNAALFREYPAQLSLVPHGNDHTWLELARSYPAQERQALLAEALQRMTALEVRHQVAVRRVMEAPYGVIALDMIEPLLKLGYEATLITPAQFLKYNRGAKHSATIGFDAVECLPGGLCMIPRIRMAPHWKAGVLLAALLDQPMVIVGHHYDTAGHMQLMEEMAGTINGLGPVRWMNLMEIARSQVQVRDEGQDLIARVGSRHVTLSVAGHVRNVTIVRPWLTNGAQEALVVKAADGRTITPQTAYGDVVSIPSPGPGMIDVVSPVTGAVNPASVDARRVRLWPYVRHTLMEARDRAYPFVHPASRPRAAADAVAAG